MKVFEDQELGLNFQFLRSMKVQIFFLVNENIWMDLRLDWNSCWSKIFKAQIRHLLLRFISINLFQKIVPIKGISGSIVRILAMTEIKIESPQGSISKQNWFMSFCSCILQCQCLLTMSSALNGTSFIRKNWCRVRLW